MIGIIVGLTKSFHARKEAAIGSFIQGIIDMVASQVTLKAQYNDKPRISHENTYRYTIYSFHILRKSIPVVQPLSSRYQGKKILDIPRPLKSLRRN